MTQRRWEVYLKACKLLNLSQTAHELRVSQSAISQEINKLEQDVGAMLISKTPQGIKLTDSGIGVRKDIETIISLIEALNIKYRTHGIAEKELTLKLGASHGPSIRLVPELLARFQGQFPRLCVDARTGTSKEIELLLRNQTIEVAFLSNPSNASGLTVEPIAKERLIFVVAKQYPLPINSVISTAQFAAMPLLVGAGQDGKTPAVHVIERSLPAKLKFNVRAKFNSPSALRAAVTRGMGVGVLYEEMVLSELRDGSLKELTVADINLAGHSSLVFLKDKVLCPIAAKFVEVARLHRDKTSSFETAIKSESTGGALPGSMGKQQTPKRNAAGVLIER